MYPCKRGFDIAFALLLFLIVWPLMILVTLAIWAEGGLPIMFYQMRVGMHGKHFKLAKFRSMTLEHCQNKSTWAGQDDPRVTKVGRFIRRYRLDEIPQILNVLKGEMSLVGPRPEVPHLCAVLETYIPHFNVRNAIRPGLTGLAQITLPPPQTEEDAKRKVAADLDYLGKSSLWTDLEILRRTPAVMLRGVIVKSKERIQEEESILV